MTKTTVYTDYETARQAMAALGDPLDPMPLAFTVIVVDESGLPLLHPGTEVDVTPTPEAIEAIVAKKIQESDSSEQRSKERAANSRLIVVDGKVALKPDPGVSPKAGA